MNRYNSILILLGLAIPVFLSLECNAEALPGLQPAPQKIVVRENGREITIDADWTIVYDDLSPAPAGYPSDTNPYHFCAQELQIALKQKGIQLPIVKLQQARKRKKRILIGNPLDNPYFAAMCEASAIDFSVFPHATSDPRYKEGYIMDFETEPSQSIIVAAPNAAGVYFGIKTLHQIVSASRPIKCMRIVDYPDLQWRGAYLLFKHLSCGKKNSIKFCLDQTCIDDIMDEIEQYSNAKVNTIVFMSRLFHTMDEKTTNLIQKLFIRCRKRFITPIPSLYSRPSRFPIESNAPCKLPSVSYRDIEGVWIKNEIFRFSKDGYAEPVLPVHGWIKNGSFEDDENQDAMPDGWTMDGIRRLNPWQRLKKNELTSIKNQIHTGKYAMTLNTGHSAMDKLKAAMGHLGRTLNAKASIVPASYYELTLWARRDASFKARLSVLVKQYDKENQLIKSAPPFTKQFKLSADWSPEHLAIFTHPDCKNIELRFKKPKSGPSGGQIFLDDVKMVRMNGALLNVLRTGQTDIAVKDANSKKVYTESSDYQINEVAFRENVRLSTKESATGNSLGWDFQGNTVLSREAVSGTKIKLTPDSSLKEQDVVSISYDTTPLHPRYHRYCLSSQGTYEIYHEALKKLIQLSPDYINICLDEYRGGYNRDSRCLKRGMSNGALFSDFVNNLNNLLHLEKDVKVLPNCSFPGLDQPNVRLIIWDDMVNYWHNGGHERGHYYQVRYGGIPGSTYLALDETPLKNDAWSLESMKAKNPLSKDVILASWWYGNDRRNKMQNSPSFYEERGYDFVVCPWVSLNNIRQWASIAAESECLGMLCSSWNGSKGGILPAAHYAWNCAAIPN